MFNKNPTLPRPGGYREIWSIAYPLIIMSASHTLMQFCDRKFLSLNSTADVAAALPSGILCFSFFCFFLVTCNFTSTLVAQHFGAGERRNCVKAAWHGFYFAVFAGLAVNFLTPQLGLYLIELGGHESSVMLREKEYFSILLPGGAFMCMSSAFCSFFSGRGKTWKVALIHLCICLLNILLDYIFIFGNSFCPAMGIFGAGFATTLSAVAGALMSGLLFYFEDQRIFPTRNSRLRIFDFSYIRRLLTFGTPAGMQTFLDVSAFSLVFFLVGTLNAESLAATTIILSINQICFLPLLGLGDACSIVVGQYIGRKRRKIAERSAYRSWQMGIMVALGIAVVYLLFPETLIAFFHPRASGNIDFKMVVHIGRSVLLCAIFYNFFDACKFIFMGALRGAGDTRAIMYIALCCAWGIMVPGMFIMTFVFKSSIVAIWIYLSAYTMFESLIFIWRFKAKRWKKLKLIGN